MAGVVPAGGRQPRQGLMFSGYAVVDGSGSAPLLAPGFAHALTMPNAAVLARLRGVSKTAVFEIDRGDTAGP
ncbi:MAG: hypothetical protein AVDCRST_MAG49-532 [uncultured Thermomicrobiales bacterium]|uniref:Uncharacterized protein n=1 Tax=uncultured Thermomicrobiales bacterium TaxID=1645740 RepID=A0A6J4U366_9BACT|nr:MAG: hypothetical protein AVDCRST_MAG49-532 [uncultured Thermomicrobiales bacterium]